MPELKCSQCNRFVHSDKYSDKILNGDTFYVYTCSSCAASESFERLPLSWSNLIQLVLYHLWMGGDRKHRYFRWKEDICGTIEERWDDLIPGKTKNASWSNSISSALSSNERIFASGTAIKGTPGWWALHHWEPPTPPRKLTAKRSFSASVLDDSNKEEAFFVEDDEIIISSGEESKEDLIVDESDTEEVDVKPTIIDTEDSSTTVPLDTTVPIDKTAPMVPSADLKQQLLERLLMMDSSLLQDAIKKAKAKKMAEIEIVNKTKKKEEVRTELTGTMTEEQPQAQLAQSFIPKECIETLEPITLCLCKRLQMYPVIRASPYENDLLKRCNRINYQEHKNVARLRRKLLVRRQRRKANLTLFDLDQWMYLFLKSPESALLIIDKVMETAEPSLNDHFEEKVDFPITFDPQSIPYIADPTKSLYAKLTGMAAIYGTCPYPITSPFTGKLLPEFICEESLENSSNFRPLAVLNELRSLMKEEESDIGGVLYTESLKPSRLCRLEESLALEPLSVKYTNLRKEFVGQLNSLLSDSFWPGIDVSEALEYPDYAIIALVGLSVVGCAIGNPDGYISYMYVRPDYQGNHMATKLLSILLPLLSPLKDLTLHVSASNTPAMLLYQRIGFKPEEFIVNFYDKYLGIGSEETSDSVGSKNAFLMRLRR